MPPPSADGKGTVFSDLVITHFMSDREQKKGYYESGVKETGGDSP